MREHRCLFTGVLGFGCSARPRIGQLWIRLLGLEYQELEGTVHECSLADVSADPRTRFSALRMADRSSTGALWASICARNRLQWISGPPHPEALEAVVSARVLSRKRYISYERPILCDMITTKERVLFSFSLANGNDSEPLHLPERIPASR